MAQVRVKWWIVLSRVVSIEVPQSGGNFLTLGDCQIQREDFSPCSLLEKYYMNNVDTVIPNIFKKKIYRSYEVCCLYGFFVYHILSWGLGWCSG